MKRKLSILLFSLMLSSVVFAGNIIKTEYITEKVCEAITGCWLNPLTGDCPDCVEVTRTIVTETKEKKEEKVVLKKKNKSKKSFGLRKKWTCIVGTCETMIDKDGYLIDS